MNPSSGGAFRVDRKGVKTHDRCIPDQGTYGHDCLGWTNIGKVDHLDGADKIKLTKSDAPDGKHHLSPVGWVDHVDQHVHLNKASKDVKAQWSEAA